MDIQTRLARVMYFFEQHDNAATNGQRRLVAHAIAGEVGDIEDAFMQRYHLLGHRIGDPITSTARDRSLLRVRVSRVLGLNSDECFTKKTAESGPHILDFLFSEIAAVAFTETCPNGAKTVYSDVVAFGVDVSELRPSTEVTGVPLSDIVVLHRVVGPDSVQIPFDLGIE